jgi:MFS family permease
MSTKGTAITTSTGGWTPRLALSTAVMVMVIEATSLGFLLVSTALPQISQHYHTAQGGWLITGYVLSGGMLCPLVGKLADVYGKRRTMVGLLLVSFVGAVISTTAPTFGVLVIGRLLQGAVLPTMFLTYSLMRDVYPTKILPVATSLCMTGIGVFSIGTPFLVGALLDGWGFRALFACDMVWTLLLAPVILLTTPESPIRNRSRIDFLGAGLLGVGLGVVLVGVSFGSTWGWGSLSTLGFIVAGLGLLAGFVVRSRTFPEPIVDLKLFTSRVVLFVVVTAAACESMSGVYSAMSSIIGQTPRSAGGDYGLGLSATEFGLVTAPQAAATVLAGLLVGKLINRVGAAILMKVGLAAMAAGGLMLGFNNDTYAGVLVAGIVLGFGMGLCFGAIPALVISATTPQNQASIASMVQVCFSGFSSITPVILFVILGNYVTFASDGFVVYTARAFEMGGLYMAGILLFALLLALTVLRRRRADSMIVPGVVDGAGATAEPAVAGAGLPEPPAGAAAGSADRPVR